MASMKELLKTIEFKIGSRESEEYKFLKRIVMDQYYSPMTDFFNNLIKNGILTKCSCGTSIRKGYKECKFCNGSGYCNSEKFNQWIKNNSK
jgi:hypothetical protein